MRVTSTFLLIVAFAACSNPATGPSGVALTFRGRVLDYSSNAPLASARVAFKSIELVEPESQATSSATGDYAIEVPRTGGYSITVDGVFLGVAQVSGSGYPGNIYVDRGNCVARYGRVIDGRTLIRVRDAAVTLGGVIVRTDDDGWYRIDLGCSSEPRGTGTTLIRATHPGYDDGFQVVGRGIFGVSRLDLLMTRQ